jgi:cobalt-zinc-cadmium efflux system protein
MAREDLARASQLKFAVTLTAVVVVAELVGGVLTGSLALLSDAGHMLTDVLSLGLAYALPR